MKFFTLFAIIALIFAQFAVVLAAPPTKTDGPTTVEAPQATPPPPSAASHFDGFSKCWIQGSNYNRARVIRCCRTNHGTTQGHGSVLRCRVPILREGYYRKCIFDLHYPISVRCNYY